MAAGAAGCPPHGQHPASPEHMRLPFVFYLHENVLHRREEKVIEVGAGVFMPWPVGCTSLRRRPPLCRLPPPSQSGGGPFCRPYLLLGFRTPKQPCILVVHMAIPTHGTRPLTSARTGVMTAYGFGQINHHDGSRGVVVVIPHSLKILNDTGDTCITICRSSESEASGSVYKMCVNHLSHSVQLVRDHLITHGIDDTYTNWTYHGEQYDPPLPYIVDEYFDMDTSYVVDSMDDTTKKPTDAAETEELVQAAKELFMDDPTKFREMLEDAEKPLYEGCPDFTKLSAIIQLLNLKSKYGVSDKFFTELLILLKKMLPERNEMYSGTYEAKKAFKQLGSGYEKIHACVNRCILYRHEYEHLTECPNCGKSRWKVDEQKYLINKWGRVSKGKDHEFQDTSTGRGGMKKKKRKEKQVDSSDLSQHQDSYWKKFNIWYRRLRYWRHNSIQHCIDFMQIEKNVAESIIGTLLDVPNKTKDGHKARLDLVHFNLKPELHPKKEGNKTTLSPAACTLTKEEKDKFCKSLYHLKVPQGYCSNFSSLVSLKEMKLIGLKSHDYYMLMQEFLHVTIRSMKHEPTRIAITSKEIKVDELDRLQEDLCVTLCLLEKHFPPAFFDVMIHLTIHLTREVYRDSQVCKDSVTATVDWLSHKPNINVLKYDVYAINGYTFRTKSRECKGYQDSGVSVVATNTHISKDVVTHVKNTYYGVLQEIWVLDYNFKRIPIFKCDWVDSRNEVKKDKLGYTLVELKRLGHYKDDPFILASQAQQTPPKNYRDAYDDVDEEFSTTVCPKHDNILPRLHPVYLHKENDYFRTDCQGIVIRKKYNLIISQNQRELSQNPKSTTDRNSKTLLLPSDFTMFTTAPSPSPAPSPSTAPSHRRRHPQGRRPLTHPARLSLLPPARCRLPLLRAGISAKKEAPVNFLTDPLEGRSTLRPADILVFGWIGGKHACVDLTGVSPLVGLRNEGFIMGQAALKAAACKVMKHEKACLENQHVFIPFAFDTFGFLAPEAVHLLNRVQRVMHSNVMTPKSMDVVFQRVSFAIQKGVAAQLVARLSSTTIEIQSISPSPPDETRPVQPATTPPTTEPNPAYQQWKKKDRYVLLWLKSTLSERSLAIVARASSSRTAWLAIETTFQAQTRARRMAMKGELQTLSKGSLTMLDYIEKKRSIADALAETLNPISTEDLIGYILSGLDSSYSPFTAAFMVHGEDSTVDDLIGLLLQEEARLEQDLLRQQLTTPPTPNSSTPLALNVHRSQHRYPSTANSSSSSSHNSGAPRQPDSRRRRPHCQLCNKPGHEALNCWQRNNQIDYPSRRPNPRDSNSRQAHFVQHQQSPQAADPNWYLDSGATDHVAPDLQKLHIAEDYHGPDQLQVGNGNNLSISHIGSTSLHSLQLPSVLVVPQITKHLLSVSRLTADNDIYLNFHRTHCSVKSLQGQTLLRGHVRHGLYCFPSNNLHNKGSPPSMALTGVRTSVHGWHQRLAHPHEPLLRRLLSTFNLPVSSNKFPNVCEPCQLGKSHRFHLPTSHVASSKPFDLVYSDVWGPSPFFSINGNRYFLLFIDDCSKFVWIYFLSQKSQVLSTFKLFHKMVQTQFNTNIKYVQSDWGGEYRPVSSYLASHGIEHRLSCPYTQEQNGAVERRNRVIVEKGLSLLAQSHLPHTFWEHAFKTATYLHNRTITPLLDYTSPYQNLYSKIPDYAFLKTFGCLCYPFLRPYNHHKIDFRSMPCVFIGYSPTHKGYLCYHQPSSRIYIARHVVFNEDVFPYFTPPVPSKPESASSTPLPSSFDLLQTATNLHSPPSPPPSSTPSITSDSSPPSNSPPHYTNSTMSSRAKQRCPSTSHYRPAENSHHSMTTRAQTNSLKPRTFVATTVPSPPIEPTSFLQAIKQPCWKDAMQSEFDALMRNRTWSLVTCPTNVNIVGCKWIYRIKRRSDGSIERHKARLVAQGYSQEEGVDYFDTFSPVIKPTTIRLVLSLAVSKGWVTRQLDINNAFLNGDLQENVYMRQPKGFEDPTKPHHVCKLHKALYGLKQAPRAWFTKLKQFLLTQGFRACQSDTSLFVHHSSKATIYVLVYVDDLIITGTSPDLIQNFINHLHRHFALKDLGALHFFLGIHIQRNPTGLVMSQEHYIHSILERTKMADAKPISTPADTSCRLVLDGDPFSDHKLYRQVIGSLQYATITRPDITYAVNRVCQYMHSPTTLHWQAVKRILRYLKETVSECLHFKASNPTRLVAFSDAGWISDKDDSRSQYGYAIFHGSNLISWTSRKQKVVARSSTEAEYRSLAYTAAELIWIQQLLTDLHAPLIHSPHILCDNIGAIFMTKNPVIRTRSKHIALDFHFIREQVESNDLSISSVSSVDQLADIFTKSLHKERLMFLRNKLQIRPAFQLAGGMFPLFVCGDMDFKVGQRIKIIDHAPGFVESYYTGTVVQLDYNGRVAVRYEKLKDYNGNPVVDDLPKDDLRPVAPEVDVKIEKNDIVNAWDGEGWRHGKIIRKAGDLYIVDLRFEPDSGSAKIDVFRKEHLRIHQTNS
ncbi:hypothetical protein LXL04_029812 [Taraxacum kok-saghyz]